jgi:CO/xanthine dehydrogenase FAD-binding subunit
LQDLGLDAITESASVLKVGAAATLQSLLDCGVSIPPALGSACQLEASLNLRNMATLGGTILSADGRSPLLASLLALDVEAELEPSAERLSLDELLERRSKTKSLGLITWLHIPLGGKLAYDQVARAPYDRPIVCAAVGVSGSGETRIVLGGYGARPQRIAMAEKALKDGIEAAAAMASEAYSKAEDPWASGAYRGHAAGVLVRRLLEEVRD